MNFVVEFYKGLDTINLIIFWGVIIVVLLLLIFAIIITKKNHKLERIIIKNGIDIDEYDDEELAIKRTQIDEQTIEKITVKEETMPKLEVKSKEEPVVKEEIKIEEKPIVKEEPKIEERPIEIKIEEKPVPKYEPPKEEKFIAEEHVMEYHNTPNKVTNNVPYQHNVFRETTSQTSPIGIAIRHSNSEKELAKARELHEVLRDDTLPSNENHPPKNPVSESFLMNQKSYANTYKEPVRRGNYLDELSKKMADTSTEDITRTAYELKQEEEAIISYQELLEKKDSIKPLDEEEAVISIDELLAKKREEEKLYNITKEEEDDDFIKELKQFRSDL